MRNGDPRPSLPTDANGDPVHGIVRVGLLVKVMTGVAAVLAFLFMAFVRPSIADAQTAAQQAKDQVADVRADAKTAAQQAQWVSQALYDFMWREGMRPSPPPPAVTRSPADGGTP